MDKSLENEIRQYIRNEVSDVMRAINVSKSSVKLSRNASGKLTTEIKAYGDTIEECVNRSRAAYKFLASKHFNEDIDDEQMPPIESYTDVSYKDVPQATEAHPEAPPAAFDGPGETEPALKDDGFE